jgi:Arc/MetJ-type ribon-helix-helix transcriptional regulator
MLVYADIDPENKRFSDWLVENDHYDNHSDVINAALQHLYELHKRVEENQGLLIVDESGPDCNSGSRGTAKEKSRQFQESKTSIGSRNATKGAGTGNTDIIPDVFRLNQLPEDIIETLPPATISNSLEELEGGSREFSPDEWVFGQYNRFLPLKTSCRAFANIEREGSQLIDVTEVTEVVSRKALELGEYFRAVDERFGLKGQDRVSTAFPKGGSGQEKSRKRFASQFVAEVSQAGKYRCMPRAFRLIEPADGKHFQLNKVGWAFARLENPVLDDPELMRRDPGEIRRLSEEERELLIDHILAFVPREVYAFRVIFQALQQGGDTPNEIDSYLKDTVPGVEEVSASYLTSQRSGAISRMADLGLVRRVRDGNRVRYETTDLSSDVRDRVQSQNVDGQS